MKEVKARRKDLGGFSVSRILPSKDVFMVGPFIFIDHMGPADFAPGEGIDVRPHPHIGLSTLTYMFEGSLHHRDSLGNCLEVLPGDVNWMTAGSGIVHSERETIEVKAQAHRLNGMQCWLALPKDKAEIHPSFTHINKSQLPHFMKDDVLVRLIAGEAFGLTSPIKTFSQMHYLDVLAKAGKTIQRPNVGDECAVYVVAGSVEIGIRSFDRGCFVVLEDENEILAKNNSRVLLLGGEAWKETPHIFWNFVSFSRDRIEKAKEDWRTGKFPCIPGDDAEYTPLPGE